MKCICANVLRTIKMFYKMMSSNGFSAHSMHTLQFTYFQFAIWLRTKTNSTNNEENFFCALFCVYGFYFIPFSLFMFRFVLVMSMTIAMVELKMVKICWIKQDFGVNFVCKSELQAILMSEVMFVPLFLVPSIVLFFFFKRVIVASLMVACFFFSFIHSFVYGRLFRIYCAFLSFSVNWFCVNIKSAGVSFNKIQCKILRKREIVVVCFNYFGCLFLSQLFFSFRFCCLSLDISFEYLNTKPIMPFNVFLC